MSLSIALAPARPGPYVIWTAAILAVALLLVVGLTLIIRRREAQFAAPEANTSPVESQRIERATTAKLPTDLQKRLSTLTAELDRPVATRDAGGAPAARQPDSAAGPAPEVRWRRDDATEYFGEDRATGETRQFLESDRTASFSSRSLPVGDSTARFASDEGSDPDSDLDDGPWLRDGRPGPQDSTRFFASPALPEPSETRFFAPDADAPSEHEPMRPQSNGSPLDPAATTFFSDAGAGMGATDPAATRFFSGPEFEGTGAGAEAENDDVVQPRSLPPGTRFFTPGEADDAALPQPPQEGMTGMLQALPPRLSNAPERAALREMPQLTGALQALPVSSSSWDAATVSRVRSLLAVGSRPNVVAICALDPSGEVICGDEDADFIAELHSLIAEAGAGSATDVDQPVRLGDDARGALLVIPTGAPAVLGALVLESGDSTAMRAELAGLARQIGDAMRRAS